MALFGNNGFFDNLWQSIKDDPLENIATLGAYGTTKATARMAGKHTKELMDEFSLGFNPNANQNEDLLQSELAVKEGMRAQAELTRARQARARSASLLTSTNSAPSLLG